MDRGRDPVSYGHATGLCRLTGADAEITPEEQARHEALCEEFDRMKEEYADARRLPKRSPSCSTNSRRS